MTILPNNSCFFPAGYYANPHSSHPGLNEELPSLASGTKRSASEIDLDTSSGTPKKLRKPTSPAWKEKMEECASMLAYKRLTDKQLEDILNPEGLGEAINEASRLLTFEKEKKPEKERELFELVATPDEDPVANMLASVTRQEMSEAQSRLQTSPAWKEKTEECASMLAYKRLTDKQLEDILNPEELSGVINEASRLLAFEEEKKPEKERELFELAVTPDEDPVANMLASVTRQKESEAQREVLQGSPPATTKQKSLTNLVRRRPNFRFSLADVPIGAELSFIRDTKKKCSVFNDQSVTFNGEVTSLTHATSQILHTMGWESDAKSGSAFWSYEGVPLDKRRRLLEEKEDPIAKMLASVTRQKVSETQREVPQGSPPATTKQQSLTNLVRRRPNFRFSLAGVPIGAELSFIRDSKKTCSVFNNRKVMFDGRLTNLTHAASQILRTRGWESDTKSGPAFWSYEGVPLDERRRRLEEDPETDFNV